CADERIEPFQLAFEVEHWGDVLRLGPVCAEAILTLGANDAVQPELDLFAGERSSHSSTCARRPHVLQERPWRPTHPEAGRKRDVARMVSEASAWPHHDAREREVSG